MVLWLILPIPLLEVPIRVLFGWLIFPFSNIPKISVNWTGLVTGVVAACVYIVGFHALAGWISRFRGKAWSWRRTALFSVIVLVSFTSGIAAIGVVHQVSWIRNSPLPLTTGGIGSAAHRARNLSNIRQIGIAIQNSESHFHSFPTGIKSSNGELLHGWMSQILPYIEGGNIYSTIRFDKSWNSPENATAIGVLFRPYICSGFDSLEKQNGIALTHYAGNVHVLPPGKTAKFSDITDGQSLTMLAAQVPTGFRPWAHPLNLRDPAKGIGFAPDKFGSPVPGQDMIVCMADISTRSISSKIHPKVLKALATPNGNEPIEDYDEMGKTDR
jgi:hypothetical protein